MAKTTVKVIKEFKKTKKKNKIKSSLIKPKSEFE